MVRVEESVEIARPREEVWEFVAEPLNDPRWCPKVKRVEPAGDGLGRFTQISEFEWKNLPRILHGTFRRGVKRDVRGQLRRLKRELEQ